jgi:mRNA interferase MazF
MAHSQNRNQLLIISNTKVNNPGDYILVQLTSEIKRDGLSIEITGLDYKESPFELKSHVRFHKIFILNESLILGKMTSVTNNFREKVLAQILAILK